MIRPADVLATTLKQLESRVWTTVHPSKSDLNKTDDIPVMACPISWVSDQLLYENRLCQFHQRVLHPQVSHSNFELLFIKESITILTISSWVFSHNSWESTMHDDYTVLKGNNFRRCVFTFICLSNVTQTKPKSQISVQNAIGYQVMQVMIYAFRHIWLNFFHKTVHSDLVSTVPIWWGKLLNTNS